METKSQPQQGFGKCFIHLFRKEVCLKLGLCSWGSRDCLYLFLFNVDLGFRGVLYPELSRRQGGNKAKKSICSLLHRWFTLFTRLVAMLPFLNLSFPFVFPLVTASFAMLTILIYSSLLVSPSGWPHGVPSPWSGTPPHTDTPSFASLSLGCLYGVTSDGATRFYRRLIWISPVSWDFHLLPSGLSI